MESSIIVPSKGEISSRNGEWLEVWSEKWNKYYWWNERTGESSWTKPNNPPPTYMNIYPPILKRNTSACMLMKAQGSDEKNCFKWALERVLANIVLSIIYPGEKVNFNITYKNREEMSKPIKKYNFENEQEARYMQMRIGLALFFGDWITLYCGTRGISIEALNSSNIPVTGADVFTHETMRGKSTPQKYSNNPEVILYNFSRIVNFIRNDMSNLDCHLSLLLTMKYPICLNLQKPSIEEINDVSTRFNGYPSGNDLGRGNTYSYYVSEAFTMLFRKLVETSTFLDTKSVTIYRKPLINDPPSVFYQNEVDNLNAIIDQINKGWYAELTVYLPDDDSWQDLDYLTDNVKLQGLSNHDKKNIIRRLTELKGVRDFNTNNIEGHSMALKKILYDGNQYNVTFMNSWENQVYTEYPVNIFLRAEVHALIDIPYDPGYICNLSRDYIYSNYPHLSSYVPGCISQEVLQMVANPCFDDPRPKKKQKGGKSKTTKRRAKSQKIVTRKKRTTCRVKACRILKRRRNSRN
jgi:hypothetical protein